ATALEVNVGVKGANQSTTGVGGWNGGGNGGWHENGGFQVGAGGGGASDIRLPGASAAQALVVAGGGGGFGGNGTNLGSNWFGGPGGAGGLVPQSGQVGSASGSGSDGGVGGAGGAISGPVGANGENTSNGDDGAGGGGGGGWNSGAGGGAGQADKISLQVAGGGGGGGGQSYASPTYVTGAVDTVNFGQFSPGVSVTYLTFDDSAPTKTIEAGQPTSWAYNAGASATYAVASGSLPPGMTLNGSTGVVAGTPLTTGVFTFAVSASLPLQQFGGTLVSTTSTTATVIPAGPTAPSSPTLTSAFAGPGTATVTWTAPSSSGSSPLVNYVIGVSPNGGQTWSIWASVPAGASQTNYTGFLPAGTYVFQVSAVNQTTVGPPSATSQPVTVTSVSNAPTNVSGVPGYESVALSWSAPTQTGGTPITGYGIRYSTDGGGFWAQLPNTGSAATSFTVTGLTSQAGYIFEVAAINAAGRSPWSQASPLLQPLLDPGAVTDVVAAPAYQAVALTWLPPANTAVPVTGYVVRRSDDSGNSWSTPLATGSTATQFTYPGLTQPVPLVFQVAAVNANGQGPWSTASAPVTPDTVPAAPSRLRALAGDRTVLLSWNPPADLAGGTLSGYRIEYQVGSGTDWIVHTASTGTTATQLTIVNLVNGTSYRFRVAAITQLGVGVPSQATADVIPFTVPGAALGLVAAAGNGTASLAWQPPAVDGGRRIVGYRIEASGQSGWYELVANTGTTATGYAATGLVNGTTYLFRVAAINAAGVGVTSLGSNAVVPAGPAAPPVQVRANTGTGSIALSWMSPVVTGGLPITSYVVRWSSNGGATWQSANTGGPAPSYRIVGLNGSLTSIVQVAAVTGAGQGAWSTPLAPPSAVRSIGTQSLPGGRVRLAWMAPASNGGSPMSGYLIWMSTNGRPWVAQQINRTGSTTVIIGGLSRLATYRFMIQPLSVAWPGPISAPTRAVRPR
ncbi:MAG: fibronectin type III domain-containing protein, partial [Planctomycetota bacterium]